MILKYIAFLQIVFKKSIVHLYQQQIFMLNMKFSLEIIYLYLNFIKFIVEKSN